MVLGRHNEDIAGVDGASRVQIDSSSHLLQLRQLAIDRIVNEMIAEVRQNCTLSPEYIVLILDSSTARLFSQLQMNYYELYRQKVYQVEDLAKKRKRYPMTDVIYFIEPSLDSIKALLADFPAQDKFDYDQYGQVHIVFTSTCPDSELEKIAQNVKLAQKVMSFVEANIDFQIYMDNIFLVSAKKEAVVGSKVDGA